MIIEGVVTSRTAEGRCHAAAMGPVLQDDAPGSFLLRPFRATQTLVNLTEHREGVFHIVDDVLVIAELVTGGQLPKEELVPASAIEGWIWPRACQAWEFRVERIAEGDELRASLSCQVVREHTLKPFRGFNRAAHALLELAIAVTRLHLLPSDEVHRHLEWAETLTAKTGGQRERRALELLRSAINQWSTSRTDKR